LGGLNIKADIDIEQTDGLRKAFVFGQLGQSLDGRIATVNGASKYINGSAALDHLHALRAEVDAVIVGVGTVLADDPMLTVRRCSGQTPRAVVIDTNRRTPGDAKLFEVANEPPLFIRREGDATGDDEIGVRVLAPACPGAPSLLDPIDIVSKLCERGYHRILIEGGASTLSHFINHRAIDQLHILQAPMILGSGVTGLNLSPIYTLDDALRPTVKVSQFDDGDVLFECTLQSVWSR
jgi:diaminohydroxyphosphoribosylaminopyrimidine deaminase/5-amino-6-(5-phosphoribosylamino)uracil reductase